MLMSGKAVVIGPDGLLNYTSAVAFVAWGELKGAHMERPFGISIIALELHDVDAVVGRTMILNRLLLRYSMKSSGIGLSISTAFISVGAERTLDLILGRISTGSKETTV